MSKFQSHGAPLNKLLSHLLCLGVYNLSALAPRSESLKNLVLVPFKHCCWPVNTPLYIAARTAASEQRSLPHLLLVVYISCFGDKLK
jgi:hypothetical protein